MNFFLFYSDYDDVFYEDCTYSLNLKHCCSYYFCDYYNIPYRTVTDWEAGKRKMPEYVLELMEFKADVEQLKTANT